MTAELTPKQRLKYVAADEHSRGQNERTSREILSEIFFKVYDNLTPEQKARTLNLGQDVEPFMEDLSRSAGYALQWLAGQFHATRNVSLSEFLEEPAVASHDSLRTVTLLFTHPKIPEALAAIHVIEIKPANGVDVKTSYDLYVNRTGKYKVLGEGGNLESCEEFDDLLPIVTANQFLQIACAVAIAFSKKTTQEKSPDKLPE